LAKSSDDNSLKSGNHGPEFVFIGSDLSYDPVNPNLKLLLQLDQFEFISDFINHTIQLVEMLLVKLGNVGEEIGLSLLPR
jgi:hypothetical protein